MKIHKPVVEALLRGWELVFNQQKPAERVLDKMLKSHHQFGSRDRKWIAQLFYEGVRWWRPLVEVVCDKWDDGKNDYTSAHFNKIFECLYQNLENRNLSELGHSKVRASRLSLPDWLDEYGFKELKSQWELQVQAMNQMAPVFIRVNTLRADLNTVIEALADENIQVQKISDSPYGLQVLERKNVFQTWSYKKGYFEVQDVASQKVAEMLNVHPRQTIIDACAGAGGKSLHIAMLIQNKGRLIALDVIENKLAKLKLRARRAGVSCLETRLIESKTIKRLAGQADRLLLDVPCSGLGVLRRKPGTKWYLSLSKMKKLQDTQKLILNHYVTMLKSNGEMVYSTCSILPTENDIQVQQFCEDHKKFKIVNELKMNPAEKEGDGFYAAHIIQN